MRKGGYFANHSMYDYIRLELPGYIPPAPGERDGLRGQQLQSGLLAGDARRDELQYFAFDHERQRIRFDYQRRGGSGMRQRLEQRNVRRYHGGERHDRIIMWCKR